jgi:hypothetical protein
LTIAKVACGLFAMTTTLVLAWSLMLMTQQSMSDSDDKYQLKAF